MRPAGRLILLMGHACTHGGFPPPPRPNGEHPIVAVLAVLAMVLAILLITWARVEVHGTGDLEEALTEPAPQPDPRPVMEREVDAAVAANRFAAGVAH
jgi:hypothetical protein